MEFSRLSDCKSIIYVGFIRATTSILASLSGPVYGLNATSASLPTTIAKNEESKDSYELKFYLTGVFVLVFFLLFMIYGALHEIEEDGVEKIGEFNKKQKKKKRKKRKRRIKNYYDQCEHVVCHLTEEERKHLIELRTNYGCTCLCTCMINEIKPGVQLTRENDSNFSIGPVIVENIPPTVDHQKVLLSYPNDDEHGEGSCSAEKDNTSSNNRSPVRIMYRNGDPSIIRPCTCPSEEDIQIWIKRNSCKNLNSNNSISDIPKCNLKENYNEGTTSSNTSEDELLPNGSSMNDMYLTEWKKHPENTRWEDIKSKFHKQRGTWEENIRLISLSSEENSPLHTKRLQSSDPRKYRSIDVDTTDDEDVWLPLSLDGET